MGSVNVSQSVDYEGYASEYAYATISWDEGPKVTVSITSMNVVTWRIRGRGSDTREYCVGTGGARTGTFEAEDGKDYVFQIYSQAFKTYSDGDVFTVDFGSSGGDSGDSGDSGDDDDERIVRHLSVITDDGIESVNVYKSWDEANGNHGEDMSNGGWIYSMDDCIHVEISDIKVKPGYTLDTYSYPDGISRGYKVYNLTLVTDGVHTWSLANKWSDASITFSTTIHSYKLTISEGEGASINVTRTDSRNPDASIGKLSNGDTIYHYDDLEISITAEPGYEIQLKTIDGEEITEDIFLYTVSGDTSVGATTRLLGMVYIDNGTTIERYLIYIEDGVIWHQVVPYSDNGKGWDMCS